MNADTIARRWRAEVRRALPDAAPELVEELGQHLADRWLRVRDAEGETAADRVVFEDLRRWQRQPLPSPHPPRRRVAAWIGLRGDARSALLALRARPVLSVGAILLSTIAVTGVVCAFAIVYGILWRPLPYPADDRLAVVWQVRGGERGQISYPDFTDVASADVFESSAALSGGRGSLRIGDVIHRVNVIEIEAPGLAMLGATPQLGRLLMASDAGRRTVMISHRLWSTRFGSDPAVVGRLLWVSDREYTVVGVLPPGFDFELPVPPAFVLQNHEIWMIFDRQSPMAARREVSGYQGLVRLAPGRTLQEAQVATDAIGARLAVTQPSTNADRTFRLVPLKDQIVAPIRRPLLFVAAAACITLLVALANLAVVALVRARERRADLAVRHALGATTFRLRRQLFAENLLVAICGGFWGVALARSVVDAVMRSEAASLPRPDAIRFDGPVLIAGAAVVLLIAVVSSCQSLGLHPTSLHGGARGATRGARTPRRLIVAAEIGLALMLATGGALVTLSLVRLLHVDPGFTAAGAGAVRVSAYASRYPRRDELLVFFDEALRRVREDPGVTSAGAGSSLPLSGQMTGTAVVAEGRPVAVGSRVTAGWQVVTSDYLAAAGLRLRSGRDFIAADRTRDAHLTIVNESLARILFPGEDPVGRRIAVGGGDSRGDWHEVIGVVADVRHQALDEPPAPRVYDLFGQHTERTLYVVARSQGNDEGEIPQRLRRVFADLDPAAPVFELSTLPALVERSAATRRLSSRIAIALACAGLLLALIGVYSVAAAAVAERIREIGVRAALGATPGDLFRLIASEGIRTAAWGGTAGLLGSFILAQVIHTNLFGVHRLDTIWLVPLVVAAILLVLLLATLPPARRAAATDPLIALRID